jgi:protein-S-isoprenylcysteine O-methyltransferase Ste14
LRLVQLARYILAGLDQRFGWTGHFPLAVQIGALGTCLLSSALFFWAMVSNAYFSQVARIQTERGHVVVNQGPYQHLRHPAYLAMILYEVALSALLGSVPALIVSGICVLLFILRTHFEDKFLLKELEGYKQYAKKVRFRLLPGVW